MATKITKEHKNEDEPSALFLYAGCERFPFLWLFVFLCGHPKFLQFTQSF